MFILSRGGCRLCEGTLTASRRVSRRLGLELHRAVYHSNVHDSPACVATGDGHRRRAEQGLSFLCCIFIRDMRETCSILPCPDYRVVLRTPDPMRVSLVRLAYVTLNGTLKTQFLTQVLTWTGGGEQLASGALDGGVLVWSVSPLDGTLTQTVAYGGLCHPYGLVPVGRWVMSHRRVMLRGSVQTGKGSSFFALPSFF